MGSGDSKIGKQLEEEFPATEKYYGFYNYGNTCYANSVLQALYFCQPFRMAVMNWTSQRAAQLHVEQEKGGRDSLTDTIMKVASSVTSGGGKEKEWPLLTALSDLFEEIQSQKKRTGTIKPYEFITTLKRQNVMFNSTSQQDAHEFLMYLLNEVSETLEKEDKELTKKLKAHHAARRRLGGGGEIRDASSSLSTSGKGDAGRTRADGDVDGTKQGDTQQNHLSSGKLSTSRLDMGAHEEDESEGSVKRAVMGDESVKEGEEREKSDSETAEEDESRVVRTFVQSIFQGTLTNETRCMTCESVSERDENFLDVQLDVEQNCSVTHCLARFSKVERLTGTNKFSCENCGALQEAEKRMRFKVLPKILVLHLKRFKYLEHPGVHAKLSHRVAFPVELRIPDDELSTASSLDASNDSRSDHLHHQGVQHDVDPSYQLAAMVVHIGPTAQSGHYVSFIRSHDKWLSMDDHIVNPVLDTETLMNRVFGCWNHNPEEPQNSASAYILFYERKPQLGRT